jgi:Mn-containing catalase
MFFHDKRLQYNAKPDKPDPAYARKLQEVLGGKWGEITVTLQYLFQGWNCRGPAKYRDMLLSIGTEEIGHCEILATLIARLLEGATAEQQEDAARGSTVLGAIMGGTSSKDLFWAAATNPQHLIESGGGATPADSMGVPWNGRYVTASGNLLADFRLNVTAESQGRLQVARLYEMTDDAGVRDTLSFLLARDTMHQNQWLAAIEDLEAEGLEETPCPSAFPQERELASVAYQFINCSAGGEAENGRWAQGRSIDGKGTFEFIEKPKPLSSDIGLLSDGEPRFYGTSRSRAAMSTPNNGRRKSSAGNSGGRGAAAGRRPAARGPATTTRRSPR